MSRPSTPRGSGAAIRELADPNRPSGSEMSRDDAVKPDQSQPATASGPQQSGTHTVLLLASVFMAMFLVAVDRTILSTAIPSITDEFDSLPDAGWYGSVYLLTCCAFQLLFGKVYAFFSVKTVLLCSVLLFEVASAVCGAAPNSVAFIIGRAISGVGAAGIFAGNVVCVVHAVPLAKRPQAQGLMDAVMGLATVVGPLIGGGFTSNVSWRWCFYINLPFGGLVMIALFLFIRLPDRDPVTGKRPLAEKLAQLDAPGTTLLVPGVVCLLLALQWGGQTYAWSNGRIVALLTLGGVLLIAFVAIQILLPRTATVPPRILKYRSVAASLWTTISVGSSQYIFVYYLPFWFQSVKGVSAVESGIRLLPLMIAVVLASIFGGALNQKIGYYTPLGLVGACTMSVGAGLLTTLRLDTSEGEWIGYQILYGFGMGLCFQTPNLATQVVLPKRDVPVGMALMLFGQLLGAAVFVSVGQNVLDNQLLQRLSGIPGFNSKLITSGGATSLVDSVPTDLRHTVLTAYNEALRKVFLAGLVLSCSAVLGISFMEWKNILKQPETNPGAEKGGAAVEKTGEETTGH